MKSVLLEIFDSYTCKIIQLIRKKNSRLLTGLVILELYR
jgi:hypothetical protein